MEKTNKPKYQIKKEVFNGKSKYDVVFYFRKEDIHCACNFCCAGNCVSFITYNIHLNYKMEIFALKRAQSRWCVEDLDEDQLK